MIGDFTQHIGVLRVQLHFPDAQSLKDKRMVLKSLKERLKNKFNATVAEIGALDKWQLSVIAAVMVGNDNRLIDSALQKILAFIEESPGLMISDHEIEFL